MAMKIKIHRHFYENVQAAKVAAVKITNIYTDDVIERKKKTKFNDNY
jgi:hypothetical protein